MVTLRIKKSLKHPLLVKCLNYGKETYGGSFDLHTNLMLFLYDYYPGAKVISFSREFEFIFRDELQKLAFILKEC